MGVVAVTRTAAVVITVGAARATTSSSESLPSSTCSTHHRCSILWAVQCSSEGRGRCRIRAFSRSKRRSRQGGARILPEVVAQVAMAKTKATSSKDRTKEKMRCITREPGLTKNSPTILRLLHSSQQLIWLGAAMDQTTVSRIKLQISCQQPPLPH